MYKLEPTRSCNSWSWPKRPLSLLKKIAHNIPFSSTILITDIEDKYSSAKDVPNFHYPIVQAEITEYSTYTVVSRLKSSTPYIITSYGGSFNLLEYPDVCLTIPEKAVTPEAQIPLKIKVGRLVRRSGFEGGHVPLSQYTRNSTIGYSFGSCLYLFVCAVECLRRNCLGISC